MFLFRGFGPGRASSTERRDARRRVAGAWPTLPTLLSLVLAGGWSAQAGELVSGVVVDESGGAIAHASVILDTGDPSSSARVSSGDDGSFAFASPPPGSLTLRVEATSFAPVHLALGPSDSRSNLRIVLKVAPRSELVRVTAGSGYAAPASSNAATRTDAPLLDTPMAVQAVPRAVIDDRQQRTSLEAAMGVSGVQPDTYEFYDQFLIRGFDSGYGVTFRNGLQLRGINEAVNMAFVDRVEVVKGPASMLYGRIEPGGFVNMVTRLPQATPAYSFEQQVGSFGMYRTTMDATGPVGRSDQWSYRATGDLDLASSWVDNAHRQNIAVSGALAWRPSARFDAGVQVEYYDYATTWLDASIPVVGNRPADLPRSFSIIYPESWSTYPYTVNRALMSGQASLALGGSWRLSSRFHYVHSNEDQQGVYADGFDGTSAFTAVRFTHTAPDWVRTTWGVNLDLTGRFATGPLSHTFLVGGDWARFTDDTPGSTGDLADTQPLDIFHPVYVSYAETLASLAAQDATNVIYRDYSDDGGVYVQDQIGLDRWRVLVGGRFDRARDAYPDVYGSRDAECYPHCTAEPLKTYSADTAFSPRAGLLFKASPEVSIYGSYSRSFGSANGRDADGHQIDPQIGRQYEAGVKTSTLGGRMTASLTAFQLTKSNIPEYDPETYFPHIVGEARSRGVELDVAGQITTHLSTIAAFTYDDVIITKDSVSGTQGNRMSGAAPAVASLWARYEGSFRGRAGWSAGVGIYYSDERQGDDQNTWQLPSFVRFDAMLAYRRAVGPWKLSAQVNAHNLFDRTYFDHGGYGFAAYGAPRSLIASVRLAR